GTEGAEALAAAVNDAVIYNNTNLKAANGLSMYFPCSNPGYYSRMSDIMKNIGMDDPVCTDCFEACVSRLSGRSGSLSVFNNGVPAVFEKTGYDCCAITLTEEQRRELKTADAAMYIDDGEGYIVLGCDDLCETGSDNDIMLDFDDTWISIEGQPVCLKVRREGEFADSSRYTYGIVRAELTTAEGTQQDIELVVQWDSKHDEGYVSGYRKAQNRAERSARAVGTQTASTVFPGQYERALRQFNSGDRIRFVYDYLTYSGELKPYFRTGDEIVFDEELEVSYAETDGLNTVIRIHLVDIYNNEYESEAVKYTFTDEEE
ncbi:MAG: hypothetical protein K6E62_05940, partial [Lachnospiraceae bacterium]|nr:hypothetical protein [Lachnospiraceae bacterium]